MMQLLVQTTDCCKSNFNKRMIADSIRTIVHQHRSLKLSFYIVNVNTACNRFTYNFHVRTVY